MSGNYSQPCPCLDSRVEYPSGLKKEKEDYKIPEYEERLMKISTLQNLIDNPGPERLHSEHVRLEQELRILSDEKTRLYREIKSIIKERHQLVQIEKSGFVCFFKGNYSQANHPEFHYFFEGSWFQTGGIATFRGIDFKNLTPKEFMDKLMKGEGFMPCNL